MAREPIPLELHAEQVRSGDRRALARAITLVESTRPEHRARALALLERVAGGDERSIRLGISGSPGVGKSTFIEALGRAAIDDGRQVAVLTIDPSSTLGGGAILGDKTRMTELARNPRAFIRPTPSGGVLGGVARRTRETVALCEAAGYDLVIVETVGVGQSEVAVADMTDVFVVLVAPAAGDELQGIKRGIMELGDVVLVNKADGDLAAEAGRTAAEYASALGLSRRSAGVVVRTCSALTGDGITEAWRTVLQQVAATTQSGERVRRRASQARAWLRSELGHCLVQAFDDDPRARADAERLARVVAAGELPAPVAAARLVAEFLGARPPIEEKAR